MTERICATCKHFRFWEGSPGYSEYTPGSDSSIDCLKRVWSGSLGYMSEDDYRASIFSARTCRHFEENISHPE